MVDEMLRDQTQEILESVLDDDSSDVATIISGYITKKLLKRFKCKDWEKKLTVHEQDLHNDQYLTLPWILLKLIYYLLAKSLDLQCMF